MVTVAQLTELVGATGSGLPQLNGIGPSRAACGDIGAHSSSPFPVAMCGGTEGRDLIGWNATDPDPNAWTVIVERAGELEPFNGTLTDFVIAVATGRMDLIGTTPSWPRLRP